MIDKLIEQAPVLAAIVIVVLLFLRHIGRVSDQAYQTINDNTEALTALTTLIEERIPKGTAKQ